MGTAGDISSPHLPERPAGASHEAFAYLGATDLVSTIAPRVGSAVAAGDVVTAVLDDAAAKELRAALGTASTGVDFCDPAQVYGVPGFTTAMAWARTCRHITSPHRRSLVVGQQLTDLPGCDDDYWARLCVGLEIATAALPLTVLCAYLDEERGRRRVATTHPLLIGATGPARNPAYRHPHEVVLDHPPPPPPQLGAPVVQQDFADADLRELRYVVGDVATAAGLGRDRAADVMLAVNELATNTVEHGPGHGRLRIWTDFAVASDLVVEVSDSGRMDVPFPGMVLPPPAGARGRGLWLASELSDVMEVWNDDGTVIHLTWFGRPY